MLAESDSLDETIPHVKNQTEQLLQQRITRLERRVTELLSENSKLKDELDTEQQRHDAQVAQLQHDIEEEVLELKRRQDMVEQSSPLALQQIENARIQLGSLEMSELEYDSMKQIPQEHRSLVDEVRMVMHEGLKQLKRENEALRSSEKDAKAAHARLAQEKDDLRAVVARLKAAEAQCSVEAGHRTEHELRIKQLQEQLSQAQLSGEINQAKADLYDDVARHAQTLEGEVKRLSNADTACISAQQDRQTMSLELKDCVHKLQLCKVDNDYLSREMENLKACLKKEEAQCTSLGQALAEEKARTQDLCSKLLQGEDAATARVQKRIDEEVTRVREAARADVATLREESRHSMERETRLLRDLRDQKEREAEHLAGELKDCKRQLDEATKRYHTLQHKFDVHGGTLAAELKIKCADADRAQVMLAERDDQLKQLERRNDLLARKVRVLTESLQACDPRRGGRGKSEGTAEHALSSSCEVLSADENWHCKSNSSDTTSSVHYRIAEKHQAMEQPEHKVAVLAAQCRALEHGRAELVCSNEKLQCQLDAALKGITTFK